MEVQYRTISFITDQWEIDTRSTNFLESVYRWNTRLTGTAVFVGQVREVGGEFFFFPASEEILKGFCLNAENLGEIKHFIDDQNTRWRMGYRHHGGLRKVSSEVNVRFKKKYIPVGTEGRSSKINIGSEIKEIIVKSKMYGSDK